MKKTMLYVLGLVMLSSFSFALSDWNISDTNAKLYLNNNEIVDIQYTYAPQWYMNNAELHNIYDLTTTQFHVGSIVMSDSAIGSSSINGLNIAPQYGVTLGFNGADRIKIGSPTIVTASQSDWEWTYDNQRTAFIDVETGNAQFGMIEAASIILLNSFISTVNNPLWLMAGGHNEVIIGNNAENPLVIHYDDHSTFKNKVILEEVNSQKGKPLCITANGEVVTCATAQLTEICNTLR